MFVKRLVLTATFASFTFAALAQDTFDPIHSTLSALIDTSNTNGSGTGYDFLFSHSSGDPDTYINEVQLNPGASWDTDIDLFVADWGFSYNFGSSYAFGTAISGDQFWQIDNLVTRSGSIVDVDPGLYGFSIDVLGGLDADARETLFSVDLELEVFNRIDLTVSGVATPDTIMAGQESTVMMTVRNDMSSRNFVSTTWYFQNGGMRQGNDTLPFVGFVGNWFDQTIAPGQERTDAHTRWTANASTPLGKYDGAMGVFGGLYNGDEHVFAMNPAPSITVIVPEPATMAALAVGAALMLRRRRQ